MSTTNTLLIVFANATISARVISSAAQSCGGCVLTLPLHPRICLHCTPCSPPPPGPQTMRCCTHTHTPPHTHTRTHTHIRTHTHPHAHALIVVAGWTCPLCWALTRTMQTRGCQSSKPARSHRAGTSTPRSVEIKLAPLCVCVAVNMFPRCFTHTHTHTLSLSTPLSLYLSLCVFFFGWLCCCCRCER